MTSITAQVVEADIVVNCIVVDVTAVISNGGTVLSWGSVSITAPAGATFMLQTGAGIGWTLLNGVLVAPAAPSGPAPTQAQLQSSLVSAASGAASAVTAQIYTDPAHAAAGQNAGVIVTMSNGAPPSTSPFFSAFNTYAAAWGLSPAAFATLIEVLMNQSMALSSALNSLEAASMAATTSAQLATALATFETSIGAVVSAVNAAGTPFPMSSPPAISIVGINS